MVSTFRNAIDFFVQVGLYDVVLPFLLVFTLMFAFLEKTKVLGYDVVKKEGTEYHYTKRSLNAMVAFVTGLFVVVSEKLVRIINTVLADAVLLLLLSFLFLLVMGSFMKQTDEGISFGPKNNAPVFYSLMAISFVAIILIFLNAIKTKAGDSWLQVILHSLQGAGNSQFWSVLLMMVVIVGGIFLVVGNGSGGAKDSDKSK